ncbi:helix-turn-helix transcriptional regulator [Antrihabitans cavernicola]|uniref:Helix-turn-helix transcriptional regulator n=2 Tax=Antrihabitans cavernicola TaxID=2495913 RepID=A0A5A7S485_9NOCA|nr:helix-turn-helix transcriptional regulator [Spelaeibacter cavernicola]
MRAALSRFAEQGYDGTRVRHIAERAGVSDAALYRHFPSVEALAQELFATWFGEFGTRLADAVAEGDTDDKLRAVVRTVLRFYREEPAAATFILLRQDSLMPALPAGSAYPLETVEAIIATGQQQGLIRNGQPNLLAAIFLGCVLRPIHLANFAAAGAFDLLAETGHDTTIESAALAAVRQETP